MLHRSGVIRLGAVKVGVVIVLFWPLVVVAVLILLLVILGLFMAEHKTKILDMLCLQGAMLFVTVVVLILYEIAAQLITYAG